MPVSLLVPLDTGDCPYRRRNWEWLGNWYADNLPEWQIRTGHSDQPWRKGLAVQQAFAQSTGDIIVIGDADCLVNADGLREAVRLVETGHVRWVVPHHIVKRLTDDATLHLIATGTPRRGPLDRPMYAGVAGGGIVVLTRDAYETVDGIDPRFSGWGGEDFAFGWTLMNLVGGHERLRNDLWHLWHPPQQEGRQPEASDIWQRYKAARDNPKALQALIDERRSHEPHPASHPDRDRHQLHAGRSA